MDDTLTGIWVFATTSGKALIGCIAPEHASCTREQLLGAQVLKLQEAYDFFSPIREVNSAGRTGLAREPFCLPFELCADNAVVYVKWDTLTFMLDLSTEDQRLWAQCVKAARQHALSMRARRSNIALPEGPLAGSHGPGR